MDKPFFFLIDFEQKKPIICPLADADKHGIYYNILGMTNVTDDDFNDGFGDNNANSNDEMRTFRLSKSPMSYEAYKAGFDTVQAHITHGDSYLLNLTYPTAIDSNYSLGEIFRHTTAPYKVYLKDHFVCFSPERFVTMSDNKIHTYPMKGTINAALDHAESLLLESKKEQWEHNTIVDLMRNDLAMVAKNITVERFRYVDKIHTHTGTILQTSSKITGILPNGWQNDPLAHLRPMLPAGSVSGAPKQKTLEIIKKAEHGDRGYYTGVFGLFDGQTLHSAVAIRYIEQVDGKLQFRSGGGITAQSLCTDEYQELIQKVYVPII